MKLMKKLSAKLLAIALTLFMLFSILPIAVFAAEDEINIGNIDIVFDGAFEVGQPFPQVYAEYFDFDYNEIESPNVVTSHKWYIEDEVCTDKTLKSCKKYILELTFDAEQDVLWEDVDFGIYFTDEYEQYEDYLFDASFDYDTNTMVIEFETTMNVDGDLPMAYRLTQRYYTNEEYYTCFDLQGKYDSKWKSTTFSNSGFKTFIKIADKYYIVNANEEFAPVNLIFDAVNRTYIKGDDTGILLNVKLERIHNGDFIKITYNVKNDSANDITYSLASCGDVQIGHDDCAMITPFSDGGGLKMVSNIHHPEYNISDMDKNGNFAQLNFFAKNTTGVTDVDAFWYGKYNKYSSDNTKYAFSGEDEWDIVEEDNGAYDSAMGWSWHDKTIASKSTQTYSVIMGIAGPGSENELGGLFNPLTSATGTIKLSQDVVTKTSFDSADFTVKNGETVLTLGTDYTLSDLNSASPKITFAESANITYDSNITVTLKDINSNLPINIRINIVCVKIKGKVMDESKTGLANATVVLKNGETVVAETETDSNGNYLFSNIGSGLYNAVVTSDEKTVTVPILVEYYSILKDIIVSNVSGNKNTVVEQRPGTPNISADLNGLFGAETVADADKGITDEDLEAVQNGGTVEIKLTAQVMDEAQLGVDSDKIKEIANCPEYLFLDFSVYKKVNNNSFKLNELNQTVDIIIQIPEDFRSENLKLFRIHNDVVEQLTQTPNADGEKVTFNSDYSYATITVKKFSTYAFAKNVKNNVVIDNGGSDVSGSGEYLSGDTVTINAGTKQGYTFSGWTSEDGVEFTDASSATTTFIMPDKAVTVTANWTAITNDDSQKPDTGDHSNVALWTYLIFAFGGMIISFTINMKSRYNFVINN